MIPTGRVAIAVLAFATGACGPAPAQKKPLLSPRDSVRATIGAATVDVNYGRPYKNHEQVHAGEAPHRGVHQRMHLVPPRDVGPEGLGGAPENTDRRGGFRFFVAR